MTRFVVAAFLIGASATMASAQTPDVIQRGQKAYTAEKCGICHSVGATGNKKGPLDGVGAKLSEAEIRQWIVGAPEMTAKAKAARKPPMKAYPNLSKEDLDALVSYLHSLK